MTDILILLEKYTCGQHVSSDECNEQRERAAREIASLRVRVKHLREELLKMTRLAAQK